MKIVFLLICVFLALAGVAGLPEDALLARKLAEDQILEKNDQKNTRGMRYMRYEDETNVRLTKRSPGLPEDALLARKLAEDQILEKNDQKNTRGMRYMRYEDETNVRLTKRSPGVSGPAVAPGPGPGVYSAYDPAVGPYLRPQMSSIKSKRDISKKSPGEDKPGKRIISKRSDEASSPFNVMQILEGIQMVKDIYEKSQSKLSPKDHSRMKRDDFDLAEAEADPRKKRAADKSGVAVRDQK